MGQIYLVRHGQASFGSADYDRLSPLGVEQSQALGRWLADRAHRIDRVVTGGMRRHRQTADGCMGALPSSLQTSNAWLADDGFNEYDHHEVLVRQRPDFDDPEEVKRFLRETPDGKRAFQAIFEQAMTRWMSGAHDAEYRETWPQFRARVVAALRRVVADAGASQNIIVFTSGGPIATLCQHLLGLPDAGVGALNWTLVNCAVTKLFYRGDQITLSYLNSYAHFETQTDFITYR
ncbi:MAG TPA: histidine phosphatase family protein [Paucimonas sp.]|nr:histidine phosphatase family protein [Paucimonas sp.]